MSSYSSRTGNSSAWASVENYERVRNNGSGESNLTMQFFQDRPSHEISAYQEEESDIFDLSQIKTYDEPVDSAPSFSRKEVQSLKKKFEDFKLGHKESTSKSPRPIVKSPLLVLKNSHSQSKKTFNRDISPLTPIIKQPSYKKPLITLIVKILGKEVSEDLFHGDYPIDVAKKIFSKVTNHPSQSDLKALAHQIEQNVQNYITEVSVEIAKFHQNSKKIEEKSVKKKLESFKPPLLLTAKRADEKKAVLGTISLNLSGKNVIFQVKDGENAAKVAEKVCETQGVSRDHLLEITKQIKDLQDRSNKRFLFRLEFEVNGKVAELALYDGDDLNVVSQKFCREHKLGREYVTKIEEVLHKQLNSII